MFLMFTIHKDFRSPEFVDKLYVHKRWSFYFSP